VIGRRKREGNYSLSQKKKNSVEDLLGNEENGYPVPDQINVTNEPSDTNKKIPQN
jgi:hypothetical protein